MAIIIPSKHIYSKSFDPVIDNNISKLEVGVKKTIIEILGDTNVFNEIYTTGIIDSDNYYDKRSGWGAAFGTTSSSADYEGEFKVNILIDAQLFNQKVLIPKAGSNGIVHNVLTGTTEDGQNKIQCSIVGRVETGTVNIEYEGRAQEYVRADGGYSFAATAKGTQDLSALQYDIGILKTDNYGDLSIGAADIGGFAKSNLDTVVATKVEIDGKEYFELDLSNILVSLTETSGSFYASKSFFTDYRIQDIQQSGSGATTALTTIYYPKTDSVTCDYKKYKAEQIQISVNGTITKISLEDKSITVGDGNKVFSFDGNELIQTTNTPSIEKRYQEIIDKWKNGKQTATISCPITDYYDDSGSKVIDINASGKMLFSEGDIVIPYVYTNHGDKPLSYNRDFRPKQFKVVGTKISKRQGGMQELTLQEV